MTDRRNMMLGLVAGMSGLAALSHGAAAHTGVSEAEAQAAVDSFLDALLSGDPAKVDKVLAPEFQIMRSDGSHYDKVTYLNALPKYAAASTASNLKVTGHGEILVASYIVTSNQTIDGQAVEAVAPRLSVFHKEGDSWLIVAHANFARLG